MMRPADLRGPAAARPTPFSRLPIRLRLTLIFAVAMLVVITASGAVIFERVRSQVDARLDLDISRQADSLVAKAQGSGPGLVQAVAQHEGRDRAAFAQVFGSDGQILATTPAVGDVKLLSSSQLHAALHRRLRFDRPEHRPLPVSLRVITTPVRVAGHGADVLVVGTSLDQRTVSVRSLKFALFIVGPIALLIVVVVGYRLTAATLRPVELMRRQAARVSATQPGVRLPLPPAGDEIRQLGLTLNEMLERLEDSFARERTFVANASHELRTPLSNLKAELDLALRRPRPAHELVEALRSALGEVDRLTLLADEMLILAHAEQAQRLSAGDRFCVGEVFDRVQSNFAASGRPIRVREALQPTLIGDPPKIEQALTNLVENALRYGDGDIELSAHPDGAGRVELHVRDHGPGFAPDYLVHAFERFSRGNPGRVGPGAGLGLSIVRTIAHAHGGEAYAANTAEGADVWLVIPESRDG